MFKRALKAEILCCPKNMLLIFCVTLGGWLAGTALSLAIAFSGQEEMYPFLGTVFAFACGTLPVVFVIAVFFSAGFDTAVKMGCTRRVYLAAQYLFSLCTVLCSLAFAALLSLAEMLLDTVLFGDRWAAGVPFFLLGSVPWYVWAAIPAAVVLGGAFIGALFARFGNTAFWIAYVICFAPFFLSDPLEQVLASGDKSTWIGRIVLTAAEWLAMVPGWVWTALLCLLPVAVVVFTVVSLMRQPINA